MKLLSVNLARSIWICNIWDFNPKGKNLYPAMTWLVNSYKFKKFPSETSVFDYTNGVKFEDGEFKSSEREEILVNFTLYNTGFVVDTRSSTKDSDAFLIKILTQLFENFDLPHYDQTIKRRLYVSQLYVTTDKPLELINPKLKEISKYLLDNISYPFEVIGIYFGSDPTLITNLSPFTFERALNVPFSDKRYYSSASLQTDQHIELLEKLESLLSGS